MSDLNIVVFSYNFPHKKTQDFLIRLHISRITPSLVIAAPPVQLNLPPSIIRDKYKHIDLIHPKEICEIYNIEYVELDHSSPDVIHLIKERKINVGVIAGARILKKPVIDAIEKGILNFHPGLIPENRGLHAAKWAVFRDLPQGMTVHLIDERVDAGKIVRRFIVPVYSDDTLRDINLRLYEVQVRELVDSLLILKSSNCKYIEVSEDVGYHPPADEVVDRYVEEKFNLYLGKWAYDLNEWKCVCGEVLQNKGEGKFFCTRCKRSYREKDGILVEEFVK